jgi:hypothetical protein
MLLAAALAVPLLAFLVLALGIWSERRRGLPFEGMGAAFGVLAAVGCGGLLWLCAAIVYSVSIVKGGALRPALRALDVSLFLVVLLAIAAAVAVSAPVLWIGFKNTFLR